MITEGATPEMILVAVRAVERQEENALEKRRAADRARQERHRQSRDTALGNVSHAPSRSRVRVEDKTLTTEIEPQEEKKETRSRAFDAFWAVYPHKVGKADAAKAFDRAAGRVDTDTLMAGLRRYASKTDDRPWCNPSTWLNQDRWTDEPAAAQPRAGPHLVKSNPVRDVITNLRSSVLEAENAEPYPQDGRHRPAPLQLPAAGHG